MADIKARLLEVIGGKNAPQHKKAGQEAFEPSEGSDNALHTKTTDPANGQPIDPRQLYAQDEAGNFVPVKTSSGGELLTQVTGSYVGYSTDVKPTNVNEGDSFLELDTKDVYIWDGTTWVVF